MTESDKKRILLVYQVEERKDGFFVSRIGSNLSRFGVRSKVLLLVDDEDKDYDAVLSEVASTSYDAIVYFNADPNVLDRLLGSDQMEAHIAALKPFYVTGCKHCIASQLDGYRCAEYANSKVDHFALNFSRQILEAIKS